VQFTQGISGIATRQQNADVTTKFWGEKKLFPLWKKWVVIATKCFLNERENSYMMLILF
jgi:hypothetical protein